jgi:hypothetical protein
MFDLDEMKQEWEKHDRTLERSIYLNWQLLSATQLDGARSALQRMTTFLSLETLVWFAMVVALGSFIYQHIVTPRLALPGAVVDMFAIGMLAATIRQIVTARQIDYGRPIAAVQKQLETLRVLRIRTTQWGLLAGAVIWAPFAIVVLKVLFGVEANSKAWLWANLLFGLSLIPLAIWLSRKFGDRMDRSPFVQRLMRDIAGPNLYAARVFITRLSEFENEQSAT